MSSAPVIIGAGLAGLLAGILDTRSRILERQEGPHPIHRALLRFRSDAVGRATGISFRRVRVHKGLWSAGRFRAPTIALANAYSRKVINRLADRSIWNLEPSERWVAPEDFYDSLLEANEGRIEWGVTDAFHDYGPPIISTAPLPIALEKMGIDHTLEFQRAAISVHRFRIPGADVFETVYFPDHYTATYRASITGDLLIVESIGTPADAVPIRMLEKVFATPIRMEDRLDSSTQAFGKIAEVDSAQRRQLIYELTVKHGIYSLGRFATWRNILLDDVLEDYAVIRSLIRGDSYERRLKL